MPRCKLVGSVRRRVLMGKEAATTRTLVVDLVFEEMCGLAECLCDEVLNEAKGDFAPSRHVVAEILHPAEGSSS